MAIVKHPSLDNVTEKVDDPKPWVDQGWIELDAEEAAAVEAEQAPAEVLAVPAANASKPEWAAYAKTQGATDEALAGASRDQIRDRFSK